MENKCRKCAAREFRELGDKILDLIDIAEAILLDDEEELSIGFPAYDSIDENKCDDPKCKDCYRG